MSAIVETFLDDKLGELERARVWSPRVLSKLEAFLRGPDPQALVRVNPFRFARERGVPEREAVELFLYATKAGLFEMNWNLLCPACGMAVESFTSLRRLGPHYFCSVCHQSCEAQFDDLIQVSFTVSRRAREVPFHDPLSLSPREYFFGYKFTPEGRLADGTPFLPLLEQLSQVVDRIGAGATREYVLSLAPGAISGADPVSGDEFVVFVTGEPTAVEQILEVRVGAGRPELPAAVRPGPLRLRVSAVGQRPAMLIVMALTHDDVAAKQSSPPLSFAPFLTGGALVANQTFRRLFRTETIEGAEGIGVKEVTVLFTDLKGSTALYERIGDLKAFALVRQHFERLSSVVASWSGAVVKTIGDAVMAVFQSPADAVRAALQMQDEIDRFNEEHGTREIVLKIGIHRGPSIVVTLNENLDYFGQTVNVAARVQGVAEADEICVSDEVYRSAGVGELFADLGVSSEEVSLRGVQKPVTVWRGRRIA